MSTVKDLKKTSKRKRLAPNIKSPSINVPVLQPEIAVVKESQAPSFIEKKPLKLFQAG